MRRKTVPIPILIFIWLAIIGGVFWWWQGREEHKKAEENPALFKESGQAAVVNPKTPQEKNTSSDEKIIADLKQIRTALEIYYNDNGNYPVRLNEISMYFSSDTYNSFKDNYWPDDASGNQKYCLWAKLEKGRYFIGSSYGVSKVDHLPSGSDKCSELSK